MLEVMLQRVSNEPVTSGTLGLNPKRISGNKQILEWAGALV